eukprot:s2068_g2.t1
MRYIQIAAGFHSTMLLRSDGRAAPCGESGPRPSVAEGTVYTHISVGYEHAFLVRSDGSVVVWGPKRIGRCDIPTPEPGAWYVADESIGVAGQTILQLDYVLFPRDQILLKFCNLAGEEKLRLNACGMDVVWDTCKNVARKLNVSIQNLQLLLPNDGLLFSFCRDNPTATIAQLTNMCKRRRRAGDGPSGVIVFLLSRQSNGYDCTVDQHVQASATRRRRSQWCVRLGSAWTRFHHGSSGCVRDLMCWCCISSLAGYVR